MSEQSKLPTNGNFFIYGTGTFAQDILKVLTRHGIKVAGFLNHLPRQAMIKRLKITEPESVPAENRFTTPVILGIHNRAANIASIISRLKALGFTQIIAPVDLYDEFADDLGIRFWLTRRNYYDDHKNDIDKALAFLADATSRDLYNQLIHFRLTGDYSSLPQPDLDHQYFPPDIPSWKAPLRFVDCGAFNGDTLANFINAGISIETAAAFEPDLSNFHGLAQYVNENRKLLPDAQLWPCGVYSSTTQLQFTTGHGEASNINITGNSALQCVSLDEAIPTFAPNLIKMDIEGAEIEAIKGAERIINEYHPGLAISVYHKPEHLWEIPLLMEHLIPNSYRYHLRSHGFNDFDIVLYAIPKET